MKLDEKTERAELKLVAFLRNEATESDRDGFLEEIYNELENIIRVYLIQGKSDSFKVLTEEPTLTYREISECYRTMNSVLQNYRNEVIEFDVKE